MLLTPAQLKEIAKIIEKYHYAFIANAISPQAVADDVLKRLRDSGLVDPKPKIESIKDAYLYGQVLGILENKTAANMSYEQFKKYVEKNPVPLTIVENQAINFTELNGAQYVRGLGNKVNLRTGDVLIEADQALRAKMESTIRTKTQQNIEARKSIKDLKSELGWATKDWARDWDRIAITEKQNAMQRGIADNYRKTHGEDVLVARRPMPDACFRKGTLIQTNKGKVPIEQIRKGDKVLTHKLRWKEVTHIFENHYSGDLYGFNKGKPNATMNHPYLVNFDWRRVDSIKCGDYLVNVAIGISEDNPTKRMQSIFLGDISGSNTTARMPISSVQLYRYLQMRDSDINVKFVDSEFKDGLEVCQSQSKLDRFISNAGKIFLASKRFCMQSLWGASKFASYACIFGQCLSFLFRHSFEPCFLTSGLGGQRQIPFQKTTFDCSSRNSEILSQRSQRMFSRFPETNKQFLIDRFFSIHHQTITLQVERVNTVATEHFNGTVYNLEVVDDASYIADGFIVHNCKHCKRLHIGGDGQPRIFKLSTLEANGTNVGRKAADWLPVVGTVHPHCQCQTVRVPNGWGFDEEGDLVPGGELGQFYESEADLELALQEEMDLRKSFELQDNITFQGFPIAIENRRNTTRKWKASDGSTGQTKLTYAYGYFKGTKGTDNDPIDCFIGPDPRANNVYIVYQQNKDNGTYDEEKVFVGFSNQRDAERAYSENFDIPQDFFVTATAMSVEAYKRLIAHTNETKGHNLRHIVKLKKSNVDIVGLDNMQGRRNPGPGIGMNYYIPQARTSQEGYKDRRAVHYIKPEDFEAEDPVHTGDPLKRDKKTYEMEKEVPVVPKMVIIPDSWKKFHEQARAGAEERQQQFVEKYGKNKGWPNKPIGKSELPKGMKNDLVYLLGDGEKAYNVIPYPEGQDTNGHRWWVEDLSQMRLEKAKVDFGKFQKVVNVIHSSQGMFITKKEYTEALGDKDALP